ncbi:tyrosine-type recombinase/integrase [Spirillospora sp. NPDC029432]|uniref:tyrosine-type recombinase/integrase n=1 Tax=Spirillospora sp. NPDC029432 TaxID=3154599 RepID=UPI0034569304
MAQDAHGDGRCGQDGAGCGRRGRPAALPEPWLREWRAYRAALRGSALSPGSRQVYTSRVRGYLAWLAAGARTGGPDGGAGEPLSDPADRDLAVAGFSDHLRAAHGCKPGTINNYLAAIDHYYTFHRGLGHVRAVRERLPNRPPAVLDARLRGRFHAAARRLRSSRDAAICLLLVHSGMSVAELAALDVEDVVRGSRRWHLVMRDGRGNVRRMVTLPYGEVHDTLRRWLRVRPSLLGRDPDESALFVGRRGERLAERTVRSIVTTTAADAGLPITPRQLRVPAGFVAPGSDAPTLPVTTPARRSRTAPAGAGEPAATADGAAHGVIESVERRRRAAEQATVRLARNLLNNAQLQDQAADAFAHLAEIRPENRALYRRKSTTARAAAAESRRLAAYYAGRSGPARAGADSPPRDPRGSPVPRSRAVNPPLTA